MDREEILKMSRQENKDRDEREREALAKAGQKACGAGGILCGVIIILESILGEQVNMSSWAVYLSMAGTMLLVKYQYLGKKHELVLGLMQVALAAIFLVLHVLRLMGRL